jgi:hypothetical protein
MGIDWGSVAANGGSAEPKGSGIDWGQHADTGPAPSKKDPYAGILLGGSARKPSGGGGCFFALNSLSQIEEPFKAAANLGTNSLRGFYNIGHAAVRDVVNHPASLLAHGPFAPLAGSAISLLEGGGGGHLAHDVAEPIARAYAAKYAPVFKHPLTGKSYAGIRKDPLGTALDLGSLIAAVPSGGETAVLRGTALGERLGAIGEGSRMARLADRIEAARAPITRNVETVRGSGQTAKYTVDASRSPLGRIVQRNVTLPLREGPLAHVPGIGAARIPLKNFRESQQLAQAGNAVKLGGFERSLTQLNRAEHTALHVAAEGDRSLPPSMWRQQRVDFYKKQLEAAPDAGATKDIQRQLRILGADSPKLAAKIDKALTDPRPAFVRAYEQGRSVTARSSEAGGFKPETTAERALPPTRLFREQVPHPEGVVPGEHPFGENYVFPHRGPAMPRSNAIGITKTNMPLGQIRRSMAQHVSQGIRESTGRIFTSPSVITHDALGNLRVEAAGRYQDWLAQHARDIPAGGVPEGWTKFNPEGVQGHRALLERSAYTDDQAATSLDHAVHDMTNTTSEQRQMMVPTRYAKAVQQEFAQSGKVTRYLVDKPMDVWRAAVLKYRPAWLANNVIGQHMLYFLHAGGPTALVRYMQVLRVERGDGYAQNALLQALKVPAIRFKYLHMLDETGSHGVRMGTTHGILGESDRFAYTRRGQFKEARPIPYSIVAAVPRAVKAIGDANARLNQLVADDIPRGAKFITEARRSAAVRRIQKVGNEIDDSVSLLRKLKGPSTEEIMRGLTDEERVQILHKVNVALGDFTNLSPFERNKLRRVMPFYAWFKAVSVISKDLLIHHPEKVDLLRNLETAAQQNPGIVPNGKLPSWLAGAVAVSPAHNGIQEMLSAAGLNPFQTPVQMAQGALQVGQRFGLPGGSGQRPTDALGLLGPGFQLYDLFQGINPLTGAATKQSAGGGFVSSLPQVRLAQGLGLHIPGLAPYTPAKTYAPSTADLIYQYLGLPRRHVRLATARRYANEGL